MKIKLYALTGFLGSGKTTLLKVLSNELKIEDAGQKGGSNSERVRQIGH